MNHNYYGYFKGIKEMKNIKISSDLHTELKQSAKKQGLKLGELVGVILTKYKATKITKVIG